MNNLREHDRGGGGLPVGRNGYLALGGYESQKRFNADLPHVARMPQAEKTGEVVDPRQPSLFGLKTIVQLAIMATIAGFGIPVSVSPVELAR